RRCSGRSRRTLSRNHVIDPCHPTRSAITVAGNSGSSSSRARTRPSNGVNDVGRAHRTYLGGASEATAFTTVVREIPSRSAIRDFGTPSAASLRISAQSSKVITLQIVECSLFKRRNCPVFERRRQWWSLACEYSCEVQQ